MEGGRASDLGRFPIGGEVLCWMWSRRWKDPHGCCSDWQHRQCGHHPVATQTGRTSSGKEADALWRRGTGLRPLSKRRASNLNGVLNFSALADGYPHRSRKVFSNVQCIPTNSMFYIYMGFILTVCLSEKHRFSCLKYFCVPLQKMSN